MPELTFSQAPSLGNAFNQGVSTCFGSIIATPSLDRACPPDAGNHGAYVACIAHETRHWVEAGLITSVARAEIVSVAARSGLGKAH